MLVVTGATLSAYNLFGIPRVRFWSQAATWFSLYWPLLLILWGGIKVYQRLRNPSASRVHAGEVAVLILLIGIGVTHCGAISIFVAVKGASTSPAALHDFAP